MSGVTNPLSRKKASKVRNRRGHERSGECKQHETLVDSATAPIQVRSQKQDSEHEDVHERKGHSGKWIGPGSDIAALIIAAAAHGNGCLIAEHN
jgi:hypothetical protein